MLNQAWIAGGGDTAGGMHDQWNGYEGYEVWLFCDPLEALVFCPVPSRPDTIADGTAGLPIAGYNFPWSTLLPGRMWEAVDSGIYDHNIDTYYKEEFILGMEWQFARNWALDVKYIDWSIEDLMFSNTQLDQQGRNIFITGNYKNLNDITFAMADAREAAGLPRLIDDQAILNRPEAQNSYRGLQVQVNRRFQNGWSLYNNISWSETDTTGAGAWWNNTNSSYAENLTAVLTPEMITDCNVQQTIPDRVTGRVRSLPVDCTEALSDFLGQPVSTINRRGPNHAYDRSVIFNSFGFKTWTFGKQNFTLGGHFTYQTGTPWHRSEGVSIVKVDPNDPKGRYRQRRRRSQPVAERPPGLAHVGRVHHQPEQCLRLPARLQGRAGRDPRRGPQHHRPSSAGATGTDAARSTRCGATSRGPRQIRASIKFGF